eukprot:TRINITY_DN10445_c2_g1_i1.p1 TRINITY_DN10445_c2_g1~~TRINITY_DN10445_c2_g1_i1.p1  ORF type:complete len:904 (-),score=129.19 TRINITY_DN10445_c2_g1_i1:64-2571(-)
MVDEASSGHLGAPFGCAPLANALWGNILRFSPQLRWMNRDRFVLSAGHACALQYVMLYLSGHGLGGPYEVSLDQLKLFRQAGSSLPGHPEFRMTSGVEVTTGPLGQGFANGVGIAIAEAHMSARFNREGFPLFDHYTYVLAGDGCLMEGISSEAASLAGHLKLHKLIVFYDDNQTTIDGKTDLAFSEDVGGSFLAKGWNVLRINGDSYESEIYENVVAEAKAQTEKPTIIIMKTTIGAGAGRGIENTAKAHGGKFSNLEEIREKWFSRAGLCSSDDPVDHHVATLVQEEIDFVGIKLGSHSSPVSKLPKFFVPRKVLRKFRSMGDRGDNMCEEWNKMLQSYFVTIGKSEPDIVRDLQTRTEGKYLMETWDAAIYDYLRSELEKSAVGMRTFSNHGSADVEDLEPAAKRLRAEKADFKHKAGRVYVSDVLKNFVKTNQSVIGGSADVASSCGAHFPEIQGHFLPPCYASKIPGASYEGRYIHFGVREHAGVAILNGISSYACLIPYSCLFTVFYQYAMPAIRMASISKFPVLYIGTHDSIDLGEDGPTHQPVEVLPQLRAMPNLLVIRPANVEEIVGAFEVFAEMYTQQRTINQYVDPKPLKRRPVFIMTSRGELGLPYKANSSVKGMEGVRHGAYVVHECFDPPLTKTVPNGECNGFVAPRHVVLPDIVLIGSGQDVALVMKTKEILLEWSRTFNERLDALLRGTPNILSTKGLLKIRIVSMPCWEHFDEQDRDYQESVLLSNYSDILRIYVEKAATKNTGHDKYADFSVLMPSYGISGKASQVEEKLEFTPEFIATKVWGLWLERGRRLSHAGEQADVGMNTWVSRLGGRLGSH